MKESLQEATQRALLEGYKNLKESKKVETAQHLYVVQGNYGDGWEDVYSSEDREEAKARLKEYEENETEYSHRFIIKRPNTSVKDMYKDLHNDIVANKAKWGEEDKKTEAIDKEKVLNMKYDDLPDMCYGLLPSDNSVIAIKKGETGYYETDYGIVENPEEFVNKLNAQMGITPEQRMVMELRSMSGNWKLKNEDSKKSRS